MGQFIDDVKDCVGLGTRERPLAVAGHVIEPQPNLWGCGPWALRYCLLRWGIDIDPRELSRLAGATARGTTNRQLEYAVYQLGGRATYVDTPYASTAKREIDGALAEGQALLLGIVSDNGDRHWIACLERSSRGYLILDPGPRPPVVQRHGWKWLGTEMKHTRGDDDHRDFHYVIIAISWPVQRARRTNS